MLAWRIVLMRCSRRAGTLWRLLAPSGMLLAKLVPCMALCFA